MGILLWVIFGALVGWVASIIMKTDQSQGAFANIAIGIVGALLGGFIASLIGGNGVTGFNIYSFVVALIGAVIFLWIVRLVRHA